MGSDFSSVTRIHYVKVSNNASGYACIEYVRFPEYDSTFNICVAWLTIAGR